MTTIIYAVSPDYQTTDTPVLPESQETTSTESVLAGFVATAVREMDEPRLTYNLLQGRLFNPKPLLALLCWCYFRGIYSSKQIESTLREAHDLQKMCEPMAPDATVIRQFRDDNWESIRCCLARVLLLNAERKVAEGYVTKINKTWIDEEASRRMIAAAFSDVEVFN